MNKYNYLKKLHYKILRIRKIELEISKRYSEQKMRCPVHLSIGQESVPVSICENLKKTDEIVTAHRSHAHYLAKGGNLKKMIAELHGKITGCALGRGGSMHLIDNSVNVNAAVPIVGSTIPIGVGKAWANKLKKNNNIVVIFFGDGATEEGVFLESLDFAALHKLKVLFVCENNKYSVYSRLNKRQNSNRKIYRIDNSIGVKSLKLKDHDLLNVYKKSKNIINKIRTNDMPFLLEVDTYRLLEHCGPNDDDELLYRPKKEIINWKKNCQVEKYNKFLLKNKILTKKKLLEIDENIFKEIDNAFEFSYKSKFPGKEYVYKHVYKKEL